MPKTPWTKEQAHYFAKRSVEVRKAKALARANGVQEAKQIVTPSGPSTNDLARASLEHRLAHTQSARSALVLSEALRNLAAAQRTTRQSLPKPTTPTPASPVEPIDD